MRGALILGVLALAASESPTDTLRQRDTEIRQVLPPEGREVTPQERARLEKVVTRTIDLRAMVETAMGARWRQATEKQRTRLLGAFEKRFRALSSSELDGYRSTQVDYQPEEQVEEGLVKVPTKVEVKGEPVQITYSMRRGKEGWRIVDIVVDGVSTVENYRASFARVINKEGIDGLIERLDRGAGGKRS